MEKRSTTKIVIVELVKVQENRNWQSETAEHEMGHKSREFQSTSITNTNNLDKVGAPHLQHLPNTKGNTRTGILVVKEK